VVWKLVKERRPYLQSSEVYCEQPQHPTNASGCTELAWLQASLDY
jgi:hypothetical protein